jgi:hypothetical protein
MEGGGGGGDPGVYGQFEAAARKAYADTMARIKADRSFGRQDYGFDAEGKNLDGMNLLGKFQQMFRTSAGVLDRSREGAIMRGLGSKGLGARVANEPRYDLDVAAKDVSNNYQSLMSRLSNQELDAENTLQQALLQAMMMRGWGSGGGGGDGGDDDGGGDDSPVMREEDTRYADTGLLLKPRYQVNPKTTTVKKPAPKVNNTIRWAGGKVARYY